MRHTIRGGAARALRITRMRLTALRWLDWLASGFNQVYYAYKNQYSDAFLKTLP